MKIILHVVALDEVSGDFVARLRDFICDVQGQGASVVATLNGATLEADCREIADDIGDDV